jgi:type I restriction enzyme S subunit
MTLISSEFGKEPQFEKRKWKNVKGSFTHFAEYDVAVAKITPCFENSKACVFKGLVNQVGAGTTELHVFRGNPKLICPEYVYLFFKSPNFLAAGESKMTGSAGQKRVPSDFIKNCLFPLPSFSEQQRIVAKVQHLQQQLNALEIQAKQSCQYAEQLLQMVVKEAFSVKDNVVPFERKVLAGHVINMCYQDSYFGLVKFQKTLHVCEYHAQVEYETNYEQEVAGPYDRTFTLAFKKEMVEEDWFQQEMKVSLNRFVPGSNVGKLEKEFPKYFRNKGKEIRFVLQLFQGKTLVESELIATLYAVWNNRIIRKEPTDISHLIDDVYKWSERKAIYSSQEITAMYSWMIEKGLVPTGFGKEIVKAANN